MTAKRNITEVLDLIQEIKTKNTDPVANFLLNIHRDQLAVLRQANLDLLFAECKKYKIRYIFVGRSEIAGCEGKTDSGGTWPAMWAIAKNVGFSGSCGNTDQYQCNYAGQIFPRESYGAWDLESGQQLTREETLKKKFKIVVARNDYA